MVAIGVGGQMCGCNGRNAMGTKISKTNRSETYRKTKWMDCSKGRNFKSSWNFTVKGGTGSIVEYFGEGAKSLSCTGKGTIATWSRNWSHNLYFWI